VSAERQEQSARALYGEMAALYEALADSVHLYRERVEAFLAAHTGPGARVLDVGCGPGTLTRGLPAAVHVVGLDVAPEMVALAQAGRPGGDWRVHSYYAPLPVAAGTFDVAVAAGCLDACVDMERVLGHLARALRPGGRLLFSVCERRRGVRGHGRRVRRLRWSEPPLELRFWSAAEVRRSLARAGLRVRHHAFAPGFVSEMERLAVHYGWWEVERPGAVTGSARRRRPAAGPPP